ncbi:MAG: hypothetical protein HQK73_11375, partial [Desulfamplus sp.]|nr:hypothetical protein [Desulfamplus sp.]
MSKQLRKKVCNFLSILSVLIIIPTYRNAFAVEPPILTASSSGLDISLSWTPVLNAANYTLYYAPYPYAEEHTIGYIDMGSDTAFSATLWAGASFFVAVTANDSAGQSDYSNIELIEIPIPSWLKTFGGTKSDYGRSVYPTRDGGFIVTGYTSSIGAGESDVYLIKTDSNGNEIWSKTFGGKSSDYGNSVYPTSDGGFIVIGYTYSIGAGESDVYLIKTDGNGNEIWSKTFGGEKNDYGNSVYPTSEGGFIVTGYTSSIGAGGSDVYLIKTDNNGNEIWSKTLGGKSSDYG